MPVVIVTYKCGHTLQVRNPQPFQQEREAAKLCRTCYIRAQQEDADKIARRFAFKEGDLPVLRGTPKQVAWAETIRLHKLAEVEALVSRLRGATTDLQKRATFNVKIRQAMRGLAWVEEAEWWIDRRNYGAELILRDAIPLGEEE